MATELASQTRAESLEPAGREQELQHLQSEYDAAKATGRARLVLVQGLIGVGKTHLLRLFEKRLERTGVNVHVAASGREGKAAPFAVFETLLPQLIDQLSSEGLCEATQAQTNVALRLGQAQSGDAERTVVFDAVAEVFIKAARGCPLFLFPDLDDADAGSLELVRYLLRVVATPGAEAGGLWVLSFRELNSLPERLKQVLAHVPSTTLSLGGLPLEGVRSFLGQSAVAESLLALTEGNPARLEELLRRPVEQPIDLSARRLERLDLALKGVLEVLAAGVEPMTARMLLDVGGEAANAERIAAHLDALVRERWLIRLSSADGPRFRFLRDDDRAHVVQSLPAAVLKALRRRVALAREQAQEWPSAAALWSALGAVQAGPAALRAAEALERTGALEAASEHYRQAAQVLSGATQAHALSRWAQVDGRLGRFRSAARLRLKLYRATADAADLFAAGRALLQLGRLRAVDALLEAAPAAARQSAPWAVLNGELWLLKGDGARAKAQCASALTLETSVEEACALRTVVGKAALLTGDDAQALQWFSQNAQAAKENGLAAVWAQAKLNQGVAAQKLGDVPGAMEHYREVPAHGGPTYSRAQANLGSLHAEAGDFEAALDELTVALRAFARYETPRNVAQAASNLARLHLQLGDFARAAELSAHAHKLAASIGDKYLLAQAALNLGTLALEQGAAKVAQEQLAQAREAFEAIGHAGYAALASALIGRALLLLGRKADALAQIEKASAVEGFGAATLEAQLLQAELSLDAGNLHAASRAMMRSREVLLSHVDVEGGYRLAFLTGRFKSQAGDEAGAQVEFTRAGTLLQELLKRVPVIHRTGFLSLPRRAAVWTWAHPTVSVAPAQAPIARAVVSVSPAVANHGLIGNALSLTQVVAQLPALGGSDATVLIRGESGTGKEVLAQALHNHSPRFGHPLVKVNCAAMVEELLLSELFGHEKGAFTGAVRERKGRFELADGGTLFLDEIGDISPRCQVALLRVLQEREFERVGGTKTVQVDVRVICATHRDLEALIAQGLFRRDLYYRLKGVMVKLPSLRERIEDLPMLAKHFLERTAALKGVAPKQLSDAALQVLLKHRWPGNVRELENVLAAAVIFSDGPSIEPEALMHVDELKPLVEAKPQVKDEALVGAAKNEGVGEPPLDFYELAKRRGLSMKQLREEMETQCIARALVEAEGNISEAARKLGMKRSRLSQIINANPALKEVAHGQA